MFPGEGALPLWKWRGCRAPKTPIFSAAVTQWPHIFADCLCSHSKTPHFLVKCGFFNRSHPKTPYFLHSAATGSYFLFQFHWQIDFFCRFRRFFSKILLLKHSLKDQKKRSHPMPHNFEPKFGFSPNDPSFFEIVFSPNAPTFGSVSLTPISIWYWSAPPPRVSLWCALNVLVSIQHDSRSSSVSTLHNVIRYVETSFPFLKEDKVQNVSLFFRCMMCLVLLYHLFIPSLSTLLQTSQIRRSSSTCQCSLLHTSRTSQIMYSLINYDSKLSLIGDQVGNGKSSGQGKKTH